MSDSNVDETIEAYEKQFGRPTTDVLKFGCNSLITGILNTFPQLQAKLLDEDALPRNQSFKTTQ